MIKPDVREVLFNRNFLFLWSSQILSQFADRILVALLLITIHKLTNTILATALPLFSFGLSAVIFGSIAGVYVDRIKKKYVLTISNILRGILILLLVLIPALSNSLVLLFIISFFIFTISQFFIPAETTTIALIVKKKNLLTANSLFMSTWAGSTIAGFAIVSIFEILEFSAQTVFLINGGLYFLAAGFSLIIHVNETTLTNTGYNQIIKDLKLGFGFLMRKKNVRFGLLQLLWASSVIAILGELSINFVTQIIRIHYHYFGFIVSLAGVGMGFGIYILHQYAHLPRKATILIGFALTGCSLIALAINTNSFVAFFLIFILGLSNAFITIPAQTMLQEITPRPLRGRIFGIQNMIVSFAFTLPVIICGYLADRFSTQTVFIILGALLLINALFNAVKRDDNFTSTREI